MEGGALNWDRNKQKENIKKNLTLENRGVTYTYFKIRLNLKNSSFSIYGITS